MKPLETTRPPSKAAAVRVVPLARVHTTNDTTVESAALNPDAARESRIDTLKFELMAAHSPDSRRELWAKLKAEIAARSAAQVERMERERGLYRGGR